MNIFSFLSESQAKELNIELGMWMNVWLEQKLEFVSITT